MKQAQVVAALIALCVLYACGSVLDLMEVDAAQYATIAREVAEGGDWLHFHYRGEDYLDKPPLLFWLSALSFKVFGIHNWSYKLPSILAGLLALYATYRLARLRHGRDAGVHAALMLGSSLAMVLMANDVRCDTLLMACVITATWCGAEYLEERRWHWLLSASAAMALGMLAKGPMGLMAPLLALGGHVALTQRWSALRDLRLVAVPVVVALILFPMCVGLYEQFGVHGLRFYFWEQSFGRITGENVWKDDTTPLFFTHELLWQLLPWTLFVLGGLYLDLRALVRDGGKGGGEWIALSGAVLVLLALSFSHFKLPHYLYVIHPLFCILGAKALTRMRGRGWTIAQAVLVALLVMLGSWVMLGSFPMRAWWSIALLALAALAWTLWRTTGSVRIMGMSFWPMVLLGFILNLHFYPHLLTYQANAQAGRWLTENKVPYDRFHAIGVGGTALDLYYNAPVRYAMDPGYIWSSLVPGDVVYTDEAGRSALLKLGLRPDTTITYENYSVQLLSADFLDPAKRPSVIEKRYLLRF